MMYTTAFFGAGVLSAHTGAKPDVASNATIANTLISISRSSQAVIHGILPCAALLFTSIGKTNWHKTKHR